MMVRWREKRRERKARRNQKTFIYCPSCKFELVAGGEWLGQEIYTCHEAYRCNRCGSLSVWDFDLPAPVVVSYGSRATTRALRKPCEICGHAYPHYHRDTLDGEEIVRTSEDGDAS